MVFALSTRTSCNSIPDRETGKFIQRENLNRAVFKTNSRRTRARRHIPLSPARDILRLRNPTSSDSVKPDQK